MKTRERTDCNITRATPPAYPEVSQPQRARSDSPNPLSCMLPCDQPVQRSTMWEEYLVGPGTVHDAWGVYVGYNILQITGGGRALVKITPLRDGGVEK